MTKVQKQPPTAGTGRRVKNRGQFRNTRENEVAAEFRGFDDKILSMYAPGLTTRQIQEHLKDIYAVDVPSELISRVTGGVKEPAAKRRGRAPEPFQPVLFLDAPRVNIRDGGAVVKKPVYLALAIRLDGQKELGETKFRTGVD